MPDIDELYPSKYLKSADLQGRQVRAIMSHIQVEEVGRNKDRRPVLYFGKSQLPPEVKNKGLVLNKGNGKAIKTAYGGDYTHWDGKEIIMFVALVDYQGDQVEGIRVRMPKPQAAPAAPPPPAQPPPSENPAEFDDDLDGFDDPEDPPF